MRLKYENYSLRRIILDIQTSFTLQKPYCKNESCKTYLGNKNQKLKLLDVSRSDVHTHFDTDCPLFRVPDRASQ